MFTRSPIIIPIQRHFMFRDLFNDLWSARGGSGSVSAAKLFIFFRFLEVTITYSTTQCSSNMEVLSWNNEKELCTTIPTWFRRSWGNGVLAAVCLSELWREISLKSLMKQFVNLSKIFPPVSGHLAVARSWNLATISQQGKFLLVVNTYLWHKISLVKF